MKKILALCLVVVLAVTAVTGVTLAYFTDTDSQKNVMTLGKIDISQNEQQRKLDENGTPINNEWVDFAQDKPLMPAIDTREDKTANPVVNGFFDNAYKNVVDKIVTVKNEADKGATNQDAYVRTILAFETNTEYEAGTDKVLRDGKKIFDDYIGTVGSFELLKRDTIKIDGVEYVLAVKVYENALVPQEVSTPSLKQIFMSPEANNEIETLFKSEYTILALSQGTQTAGFGTAGEALDTAFGSLDDVSHEKYVDDATLIGWLSACVAE